MDTLERFLLVATGDEMVGSLDSHSHEIQVAPHRKHMLLKGICTCHRLAWTSLLEAHGVSCLLALQSYLYAMERLRFVRDGQLRR